MEKSEVLKGPKNRHFPNGLVNGFCPKIEISRMGVFYRNYVRKNSFVIFWIENKHCKTKKVTF